MMVAGQQTLSQQVSITHASQNVQMNYPHLSLENILFEDLTLGKRITWNQMST